MNFMLLVARAISHSFAALTREILFLPLEHKIHIFSPPCNILYILTSEDIDNFTDFKFVSSILLNTTRWCMIEASSCRPQKSSAIFINLRKFLENVRQRSCHLRTIFFGNLEKSSESGRKSSENRQKHSH